METPRVVRTALAALVGSWLCAAGPFPLSIPTRPTNFPLKRPSVSGSIVAWGNYPQFQMGNQTPVPAGADFIAIAAGQSATAGLKSNGTVEVWGLDNRQQPVPSGVGDLVAISQGATHSIGLRSDGTVVAWGGNSAGQTNVPHGLSDVVSIAAGTYYSLALKRNGTVVGWGSGVLPPIPAGLTDVVSIAGGNNYAVALRADGTLSVWGSDPESLSGLPSSLSNIVQISISNAHTVALTRDGTVLEWGTVSDGKTGVAPQVPSDVSNIISIASGNLHTVALKADRTVLAWGYGPYGQTNVPPQLFDVLSVSASGAQSAVIRGAQISGPRRAAGTSVVSAGKLVGITVSNPGAMYADAPTVLVTGGGGSGATATSILSNGEVIGFTITNGGSGYTSPPVVLVASPPFAPEISVTVARVAVALKLVLGKTYQIQSSSDSSNWTAVGPPFVADSESISQEFAVAETGRFFRVVEVQ